MDNVRDIVSVLGRDAIKEALGVRDGAVYAAEQKGLFPAAWFDALDQLGQEHCNPLPRSLFNWKRAMPAQPASDVMGIC